MTTWAKITFQRIGLHNYPEAEGEVSYLKNPHRHVFHYTVWVEQFHDNRDIEYLTLKKMLTDAICLGDIGSRSCEVLANECVATLRRLLKGGRRVKVEVTEDGENGAVVEP